MTGAARRPERGPPETQAADKRDAKTPRQAIKALHAAEHQLLAAERGDVIARALAEIAAENELAGAARRTALHAHYAGKIAALSPALSKGERQAAISRLRGEEHAAMQALTIELAISAAQLRQNTRRRLSQHYRSLSAGLRRRQRGQRVMLSLLRRRSSVVRRTTIPRPAIRQVASRVLKDMTSRAPPRAPR